MQKLRVILFAVGAVMSASASLAGPNDETRTIDAPPDQLLALLVESGGAGDPAQGTTDISTWFLSGCRRPSYRGQQTDDRCYRRRASITVVNADTNQTRTGTSEE